MTDSERKEARRLQPGIGREVAQSFYLMGLLIATLASVLTVPLLAARWLG